MAVTKDNACEIIVMLVNGGALLDYRTREGLTPLHKAAASGKAMSVKVSSQAHLFITYYALYLAFETF